MCVRLTIVGVRNRGTANPVRYYRSVNFSKPTVRLRLLLGWPQEKHLYKRHAA